MPAKQNRFSTQCYAFIATVFTGLSGCGGGGNSNSAPDSISAREQSAAAQFAAMLVSINGKVVLTNGGPLAGARLRISGQEVVSGVDGGFVVSGLARRNDLLEVTALGMRPVTIPIYLQQPTSVGNIALDPVVLTALDPEVTRFLFAGDVSFGRRFLDPNNLTPRGQVPVDNADALIRANDPLPGSRAALAFVRPLLATADYRSLNLETPVTNEPVTPHPTKEFAFFTLPGSLPALKEAGINYVSLGNNHVYDYLELGLADTLRHVDTAGLARSGAGRNTMEALAPWRVELGSIPYSLFSLSSISGIEHELTYVATVAKGGAADARDDAVVRQIFNSEVRAGRIPIANLHTGQEYTERPSAFATDRLRFLAASGAALVIGHHPHVAQGFSRHQGTLIAHSLGNFVFDQDRLDTMLGLMAQVDLKGRTIGRTEAWPIYLEDYRPRPVAGPLADRLLRRIGEDSASNGVMVVNQNSRAVLLDENEVAINTDRELTLPVTIAVSGFAVVDLRDHLRRGESLFSATSSIPGVHLRGGRDLLEHGDFEDYDVDDQIAETARWDTTGTSSGSCMYAPRSGAVSLCMRRRSADTQESVVALRNRIRVLGDSVNTPNKFMTLYGWVRGTNAGPVAVVSRYYASTGEAEFGEERSVALPAGEYEWRSFATDLSMPADVTNGGPLTNPRALRIFLRHAAPLSGEGQVNFDDMAIINWDLGNSKQTLALQAPNSRDFLRVEGPPSQASVRVVLRKQQSQGIAE